MTSEEILQQWSGVGTDVREILITEAQIRAAVQRIGAEITADYAGKRPLLVGVLNGVLLFMADLLRAIRIPVDIDFMAIASYSAESRERGVVRLEKDLNTPLEGRHVLFVEDVIDTGLTLNYLLMNFQARGPASMHVCTLFDKPRRRLIEIPMRYKGFELPDKFVVGYGLDYRGLYRNLPFVGLLKAEALPGQ